ncbi:cell division protein FtsZ [Pluralibacter gergoviae]|uniref:cell division protein FtsZ n=1 Tax=Pluralibacter gergoviae TaxID=61647 RepID=UPI00190D0728|nr:cell division protein FtsZ [Pluralibacter gergoviae]MBK4119112.1 cell division protein FtsZ [Pluralibacter gergoviae]
MVNQHYGTELRPRRQIEPGTLVKYRGRAYLASANVAKGLYLFTLSERLRVTTDNIEVYLNRHGEPLIN